MRRLFIGGSASLFLGSWGGDSGALELIRLHLEVLKLVFAF